MTSSRNVSQQLILAAIATSNVNQQSNTHRVNILEWHQKRVALKHQDAVYEREICQLRPGMTYITPGGRAVGEDRGVSFTVGRGLQALPCFNLRQQLRVVGRWGHHVEGLCACGRSGRKREADSLLMERDYRRSTSSELLLDPYDTCLARCH